MVKKILICILIIVGLLTYGCYWAFFDMNRLPKDKLISEVQSPNGNYTIKAYISDGGATTSYAVLGELNYNRENKSPKNIYWNYRENSANIVWIDNETVIINGHKINALNERFDFRRNR